MQTLNLLNPVEQLAKKLTSIDIPEEILREANETLRIIDVRIKTGSLGKNIDRQDTRAAIILEHLYRLKMKERISINVLAKAAGVKVAKLKELQGMLTNYLQSTKVTGGAGRLTRASAAVEDGPSAKSRFRNPFGPNATTTHAVPDASTLQLNARLNASKPLTPVRDSILPELAIRLASKVPDPHGVVQAAQRLLNDIYKYIESNRSHATAGHLHDLQRFGAAYEAAAFYYFAIQQQQQQSGCERTKSKSRRRDSDTIASSDILDLRDLETATSELLPAEVKHTLVKVEQWVERLKGHGVSENETVAATMKQSKMDNSTSKKRQRRPSLSVESTTATNGENDNAVTAFELAEYMDAAKEDASPESLREERRTLSEQWRKDILVNAIQHAKQSLTSESTAVDEFTPTDDACLEYAANKVFAKYGLHVADEI
ncbi:hypothetical protein MPSEU_000906300 [Mayamaea pseudoterrestris]|nr:hypothetical protein MPSEU_000906300 [Mayamaea pseudoterrestris]